MPNSPSATLPLPRLDDDGICDHCTRGLHRMCRHPDCECTVANAGIHSHANRPKGSAARRAKEKPTPMTATAPTPIRPPAALKRANSSTPPKLALRKVDELPETTVKSQMPSLTQRVVNAIEDAELEVGEWYEILTYTSPQGASNAVTRMSKQPIAAPYEFAARGLIVYVRLAG